MSHIMKISEAASLGIHTMVLLAENPNSLFSAKQMAGKLNVSEAHLAKVLQRMAKDGLVKSTRGPKGGFKLGKSGKSINLLNIYEAIEGPMVLKHCLLDIQACLGKNCIFGNIMTLGHQMIIQYLVGTKLDSLTGIYRRKDHAK